MEGTDNTNNMGVIFIKELWNLDSEYRSFLLNKEDRINDYMIEQFGD